jgi:hypothetical protein
VKEQVILVFNIFKGFVIILASYLLFSDFTGHCSLFIINFFVNVPTVFTKKYRHFLPQGKNGKKRRRKKLRGDKGVARGSLSSGQDTVFENKMPFT